MTILSYPERADGIEVRLLLSLTNIGFKINDNVGWFMYRMSLRRIKNKVRRLNNGNKT